ncbi:MAG: metallophosphatase family protein [Candidatus Sumerlaeia bacterium]|nr:metallophosphatase family protein [Candidatus Sumerlaeia bacterium]
MSIESPQRIAIFSDIHGNLQALEATLSAIRDEKVDKLYCCGDIVGYGGNPNECIELVKSLECPVVLGNHDYAALDLTNTDYFNDVARAAIIWTASVLKEENIAFVRQLPYVYIEGDFFFVHASPRSPEDWNYIITMGEAELNFHYFDQRFCFIGHSHQPFIVEKDKGNLSCPRSPVHRIADNGRYLINVGSVGQPRDRDPRACYAICDLKKMTIEIKRVDYDISGAQRAIIDNDLPKELAERLAHGW